MEVLQIASEFAPVADLYTERRPGRVLEIGCWDGGTLKVWLDGCADEAVVVAVDPEHRNPGAYEEWRRERTKLVVVNARSQDPEAVAVIRTHAPYEWVMIDGDHAEEAVRADVELCLPLMQQHGVMLLHDIEPPAGNHSTGPRTVFEGLRERGFSCEEFVEHNRDPWSHGIGLVHL